MSDSITPTRDQLLVSNEPIDRGSGLIYIVFSARELCRKRVLAVGPLCSPEIEVGDVVHAYGTKSGVDMGDGTFIISETICTAVEKEDE